MLLFEPPSAAQSVEAAEAEAIVIFFRKVGGFLEMPLLKGPLPELGMGKRILRITLTILVPRPSTSHWI